MYKARNYGLKVRRSESYSLPAFQPSNLPILLVIASLLLILVFPAVAGAQATARLSVNRLEVEDWPNVAVNLTLVGADGRALPNFSPSGFEVHEQGQVQTVGAVEVGPARSVPLALALTLDVSGSMSADDKIGQAKNAANAFLGSLRPEDSSALLAFSDKVQTVVPSTSDRGALQAGVNALQAGGNTAIYDALYASAQVLNNAPPGKRRVVILLTDGADTSSKYEAAVSAEIARSAGALVYTIGLGPDANDQVLKSLSEPTGGKYFKAPSPTDLDSIYKAISVELDAQLYIKYHSSSHVDRSYQLIKVQVSYKVAEGQVVTDTISYRPPPAAVKGSASPSTSKIIATPEVVQLPAAFMSQAAAPQPPTKSSGSPVLGVGAGILAAFAALFGTIGLAVILMPSLLPTPTSRRIERYLLNSPASIDKRNRASGLASKRLLGLVSSAGRSLARLSPKSYTQQVERLLTLTGPPYRMTVMAFLGIQLLLSLLSVGLILLWVANSKPQSTAQWLLALIAGLFIGLYLPYFWLKRRVSKRQKLVLRALPGALDFLAINVEAGLGFDAALAQVVKRWRNTLTDEFALLLIDFQIGKPRKDAWKDMIQRTQVPDLTMFITAMLQNEQVGVSISTLLRTQADQMRVKRRQAAEESARTAPVKMLLPMVFFIFPGVFVIILGPAIPQFLGTFSNMGK